MPKGSKKRRAAKKKKEMGISNNNPGIASHVSGEEMIKKREDTSTVGSNVTDSEINKELKPKDDLTVNNVSIKIVDPAEQIVSGSGSSSSDDECRVIQEEVEAKKETYYMPEEGDKVSSDAVVIVDSGLNDELCAVSKHSESQPLIPSASQPVKKSSWKTCCGIFELFASSDR